MSSLFSPEECCLQIHKHSTQIDVCMEDSQGVGTFIDVKSAISEDERLGIWQVLEAVCCSGESHGP